MAKRKAVDSQDQAPKPIKVPKTDIMKKQNDPGNYPEINEIRVEAFAENRALEIQALREVVRDVGGNHMAFQKLPRHMRRRAMSHNLKRIPRRLHSIVKAEIEKTKAPVKRPSRKHRRRPKNLLSEYERRKRRIDWLETHIWHAKRFKMVEKWGCKLAHHPNDKSTRACYRSLHNHCLMQDISFEHCLEITGPRQKIIDGLSHLTCEKTGLTFTARLTSQGTRQGTVTLYCYDSYPYKAIGSVVYLWRSQLGQGAQGNSTLWLRCHRSFYELVKREVNKCFNSSVVGGQECESQTTTNSKSHVDVTSLKDDLVTFRLSGPASNRVLAETLQLFDIIGRLGKNGESFTNMSTGEGHSAELSDQSQWWRSFYATEDMRNTLKEQLEVWGKLCKCYSPAEAPPHCVISLVVRDPRLLLPPRRTKVSVNNSGCADNCLPCEMFSEAVGSSPLWDAEVRRLVKVTKMSEHELNELKSRSQTPGTPLELGEKESAIPILLIQRPGAVSRLTSPSDGPHGFASGWDLILPSGWAMAFWVAMVYRGARVGGLKEAHSLALLSRQLSVPVDFPDTVAGQSELTCESTELECRYKRRPPAKRPNYIKCGIPSPFYFHYENLVKDWTNKCLPLMPENSVNSKFYVLREKKILNLLNLAATDMRTFLNKTGQRNNRSKSGSADGVVQKVFLIAAGASSLEIYASAIVAVSLNTTHRGVPARNGHICIPSVNDLNKLNTDKTFTGPVEVKHKDPYQKQRKLDKKERESLKKKKRRAHRNLKKDPNSCNLFNGMLDKNVTVKTVILQKDTKSDNLVTKTNQSVFSIPSPDSKATSGSGDMPLGNDDKTKENTSKSKNSSPDLWGVSSAMTNINLTNYNSRPLIGFIGYGDFDLAVGRGSGTGFCSLLGLLQLLDSQVEARCCRVLVRNPTSLNYKFASLALIF